MGLFSSLTGAGAKPISSSGTNIFGFGKGSGGGTSKFKNDALSGKVTPIDSQRRLRKVDIAQNVRKNLGSITTYETVEIKGKNGDIRKVKIKKNDLPEMIKRSNLIGKTYSSIARQMNKQKNFKYKDEKGKILEVDFSSSRKNVQDARKLVSAAVIKDRTPENTGPTPEEKARNIRLGKATAQVSANTGMADKIKANKDGANIKKDAESENSTRITDNKVDYKVGVGTAEQSTAQARSGGVQDSGTTDTGFGMSTNHATGIAGMGEKKEDPTKNGNKAFSASEGSHLNLSASSVDVTRVGHGLDPNEKPYDDPRKEIHTFDFAQYRKSHPLMQEEAIVDTTDNIPADVIGFNQKRQERSVRMPEETMDLFSHGNSHSDGYNQIEEIAI